MASRIFISKNESELTTLKTFLKDRNEILIAKTFLQFSPLAFQLERPFDIIFFGSPRAVMFFKAQMDIPTSAKIACVGGKTVEVIQAINREVAFSGEGKGDIQETSAAFKKWCGDQHVLFPLSSISLKTFSSLFQSNQKTEIEVYETDIVGSAIAECSTYIFTSPSNVEGFLIENSIPESAQVIAWGESTNTALKAKSISVNHVLSQPDINSLIEVLK